MLRRDEELLNALGYKQEFKRAFKPLEVRLYGSAICVWGSLMPFRPGFRNRLFNYRSIAFHLVCPVLPAFEWRWAGHGLGGGSSLCSYDTVWLVCSSTCPQWLVASILVMFVGLSMAELASAAPTSGGVSHLFILGRREDKVDIYGYQQLYYWTHSLSSPRWRNLLCWIVGCEHPYSL